jgi:ERCC4-type nuclease
MHKVSGVMVSATKPKGKVAGLLAEVGIAVVAIGGEEGNVDRYVLSRRLAVERRTGSSLLRGITDKTLFTSAIHLREHFAIPVLVVEGEVDYTHTAFNPQAARGALSSMVLQYGLSVLATGDAAETAAMIAMMARQEQIGIPEISLIPKRKAADLPDMQRRIVEMLPGAGMVLARDLLQHFGSVRRIVNAAEGELRSLPGIGARKARRICKILSAEYEAIDTERNLEDAIAAAPQLLFDRPVELLARQHHIYTDRKQRHVVDMVFRDVKADALILVELKRGRLTREHVAQLRRYLDHARQSKLLRGHVEKAGAARGLLATVEACELKTSDRDISVRIVDRRKVIDVLKRLRRRRLASAATD